MPPPNGYSQYKDWYIPTAPDLHYPTKSTFSTDEAGGWETGDTKLYGQYEFERTIQGWKLHVCVRPDAVRSLFYALSPELAKLKAYHKFADFEKYEANPETGKACVVYPTDPQNLAVIVRRVEYVLATMQTLEARGMAAQEKRGIQPGAALQPLQGGVQGDLRVGQSGFVYCRYGGFLGELADKEKIYNPETKKPEKDKRNDVPYPAFITSVPAEIQALT